MEDFSSWLGRLSTPRELMIMMSEMMVRVRVWGSVNAHARRLVHSACFLAVHTLRSHMQAALIRDVLPCCCPGRC